MKLKKQKNKGLLYTALLAAVMTTLVSLGCSNSFTERQSAAKPAAGNGRVTVLINGGEAETRTLLPHGNSFTRYGLVFTADEKTTVTTDSESANKTVDLEVGTWTLTVTGYVEIAGEEYAAATGSADFEVTADAETDVNVNISSRMSETAKGYFSYDITVPEGQNFSSAALTILSLADGSVLHAIDLLDSDTENPGTVELEAGYYLMKLALTNEYESAVTMEAVHIHSYMETKAVYGANYDWQFENFVPVAGTLAVSTISGHSLTGASIKLYSDSNHLDLIQTVSADLTESGNPWSTYISARYDEVYIKIEMTDGASRAFTREAGPFDLTNGGTTSAALSVSLSGSLTISLAETPNGSVTAAANGEAATIVLEGETVTLTVTPAAGHGLKADTLKAVYDTDTELTLTQSQSNEGEYSFTMPAADVTVSAEFEILSYSVTYNANGGTGTVPATQSAVYNTSVTAAAGTGLSKSGYLFGGWNTAANGSGTAYAEGANITVTGDMTLYAQWKSTNANLSNLTVNTGTLSPAFNTDTTAYTVNVANSVESITVTGEAADSSASLSGNSGVAQSLNVGPNPITIQVTAQDGTTTKDYTVTVFRSHIAVEYTMVTVVGGTISSGMAWASTSNYSLPQTIASFTIGQTEVTYELWYAVRTWAINAGYTFANAGREGNDGTAGAAPTTAKQEPVTYVSWRDAVVWCNAYSEAVGKTAVYRNSSDAILKDSTAEVETEIDTGKMAGKNGFRLPTEAEWEYAARGGTPSAGTPWKYTYAGSNTVGDVAVYSSNSGSKTAEVKSKGANALGLYDMSGNVYEWCWDVYSGTYRVNRGGSWNVSADNCTVSYRYNFNPHYRYSNIGFRVRCP